MLLNMTDANFNRVGRALIASDYIFGYGWPVFYIGILALLMGIDTQFGFIEIAAAVLGGGIVENQASKTRASVRNAKSALKAA